VREIATIVCLWLLFGGTAQAAPDLQRRLDADAAAGRPLVAHVVVALADNEHQGIVPVPAGIGNGQRPDTNLYWGAGYGVRYFFGHKAGWAELAAAGPRPDGVLDRVVFRRVIRRRGRDATVYLVADAYDGARIRDAITDMLEYTAGRHSAVVTVRGHAGDVQINAGGAASLIAYVGHDGLMDFEVQEPEPAAPGTPPRAAMILACQSRAFFSRILARSGAEPLLLTYGLMAPEAYTLDAALQHWFRGDSPEEVRSVAAVTYDHYQHCGPSGARRLFGVGAHKPPQ
jgi:hypothetical protein